MSPYAIDPESARRAHALVARLARQQLRARHRDGLLPWEVEHRRRKRLRAHAAAWKVARVWAWWFAWIWCLSNAWDAGWVEVAKLLTRWA
jgi:hypothetical protein